MRACSSILAAALTTAAFTACGGGSAGSAPANPPIVLKVNQTPVTFTMHWTSGTPQTSHRHPAYVPATARSASVSVNGSTAQYLNSPSTTLTISAPAGIDTFAIKTYDEQNGQGNVLSQANITQTIVLDNANVVTATLNAVVASVKVSLGTPKPNAGAGATSAVNVSALDADGNVIVGPGDYSTPIQLSIDDPSSSGTLSLSSALLQAPGSAVTLSYSGGTLTSANVVASAAGVSSASAAFSPIPTIYEFNLPNAANGPQWIAPGPDGNMWFTESPGNAVAKITPTGVVTEYATPTAASNLQGIIAAGGELWFAEAGASKIGSVTTTGAITEFATPFANDGPTLIVDGGDGNVWYSGISGNHIGFQSITRVGSGEMTIPTTASQPFGIATASDNNLYFTESALGLDKIGRIPGFRGSFSEIALPAGSRPLQIVNGPDGNLWFTENGSSNIARLSPASFSVINTYPTLTRNAGPLGITVGKDGALWYTERSIDKIGRVTTDGTTSEYPIPSPPLRGDGLVGIAASSDGSIWFTESNTGKIGRLVY